MEKKNQKEQASWVDWLMCGQCGSTPKTQGIAHKGTPTLLDNGNTSGRGAA